MGRSIPPSFHLCGSATFEFHCCYITLYIFAKSPLVSFAERRIRTMTLTPNLIACIAIGGAGILIALLSVPFFLRIRKLRRRCSARTEGTVIRYHYQPKQSGGPSIAPVAEFNVDGVSYTARLHYKGVASVSRSSDLFRNDTDSKNCIAVQNDIFHARLGHGSRNMEEMARETWRLGSKLPVVYDPDDPKCAYIDHVVSGTSVAGITLLCVGIGLAVLAVLGAVLFS